MTDFFSYIKLPAGLSDRNLTLVPESLDDDQFAARQIEFVRHVFGYCSFLSDHERETPVSDAFLTVFVNLFDVMDSNAPDDARRCAGQLMKVLQVIFPDIERDGVASDPA